MKKIISILFICTGNSTRSQIAEGLINHLYPDKARAYSAGTDPSKVNPIAITVMSEIGIDISQHYSKSTDVYKNKKFDIIVTLCDNAEATCPFIPGAQRYIHKSFADPTEADGNSEKVIHVFQRTRDEITDWIENILIKSIVI